MIGRFISSRLVNIGPPSSSATANAFGGAKAASGVHVSVEIARSVSAWFCAFDLISNSVASMPLPVYVRREGIGRDAAAEHPAYRLLNIEPNPLMTPVRFKKLLTDWKQQWGNGFAQIVRDHFGTPLELWPIHPSRVSPKLMKYDDGSLGVEYEVRNYDGSYSIFPGYEMFHIMRFSDNGLWGISTVGQARDALGLTIAAEQYESRLFRNNAVPRGYLEFPGTLTPEKIAEHRKSWMEQVGGDNQGGVVVLHGNMKFNSGSMSNVDAQTLQTRVFQINEISRFTHVPPSMLAERTESSYATNEQEAIAYNTHAVKPHAQDWEEEADRKLLKESERGIGTGKYFFEFHYDSLMQADIKARNESLKLERDSGVLTTNEWRAKKNMNPIPDEDGGNIAIVAVNMQPLSRLAAQADAIKNGADPFAGSKESVGGRPSGSDAKDLRPRIIESYRPVFLRAVTQMLNRELKAAKHWFKKSSVSCDDWAFGFYEYHAQDFTEAIGPAMDALSVALWCLADSGQMSQAAMESVHRKTKLLARHCCVESKAALVAAIAGAAPITTKEDFEKIIERHGEGRAAAQVDAILASFREGEPC